jgi:hypothetical protein
VTKKEPTHNQTANPAKPKTKMTPKHKGEVQLQNSHNYTKEKNNKQLL